MIATGAIASSRVKGRPFASSFWRRRLTTKTPHANSDGYRDYILANLADPNAGAIPYINTTSYVHPHYVVPANTPLVPMTLRVAGTSLLKTVFAAGVPIPGSAQPSLVGSDRHMAISQPSTDKYWEFWSTFENEADHPTYPGWNCGYGGYMGPDFLRGASKWSGAFPKWEVNGTFATAADGGGWGATGSGLPCLGVDLRASEIKRGVIYHALGVSLGEFSGGAFVDNGNRAGKLAGPARKTDGGSVTADAPPEGILFTLPDGFDPNTLKYRVGRIIARTTRDYGFYPFDGGGAAIAFYAEGVESIGYNPYVGANGYFEGVSAATVLADFPWDQLIALDTTVSDHAAP